MRPADQRVLVVGTTADYIEWIRNGRPGEVLFLTDPAVRREALESSPAPEEEILCDLTDEDRSREMLARHLDQWRIGLAGVACYDCESMSLAARLAEAYALPYPSVQAVANCRDKYRSKVLWREHGLATPDVGQVATAEDAVNFFRQTGGPVVLKPIGGSGSELIFRCDSEAECERSYRSIADGLAGRRDHRLYQPFAGKGPEVLAESHVEGEEYSCDFVLENGRVTLIRLTRKVIFDRDPFGTAKAYVLPGSWPAAIDAGTFETILDRSARALGIARAVCMLDFFVRDGQMVLLEMAPRPGGDCLPPLLRCCYQMDVLQLMLDFARQKPLGLMPPEPHAPMVGLRLHAGQEGTLVGVDDRELRRDPRVREIFLNRRPGHCIKRPPEDYDAWLLGHVIFVPDPDGDVAEQCRDLSGRLRVEVR